MANQFDITPADPLGTINDFNREIAQTAYLQSTAKIQALRVGEERDKATLTHNNTIAEMAFQEDIKKISPSLEPLQKLSKASDAALANGQFMQAEKILSAMSQISSRSGLEEQRAAVADKNRIEAGVKKVTALGNLYQNVDSPESKATADILYAAEFGEASPLANTPYTEGMNKALQNHFTTAKEQAEIQLAKQRALVLGASAEKKAALTDSQIRYNDARSKAVAEKALSLGKAGGKTASASKEEKTTASTLLEDSFPDMDKKSLDVASQEIAQEAKMRLMRRDSPDYASAVRDIIAENPQRFHSTPGTKKWFDLVDDKLPTTEYKRNVEAALKPGGASPALPKVGDIAKGYKYKGGDPSKPDSWEKL